MQVAAFFRTTLVPNDIRPEGSLQKAAEEPESFVYFDDVYEDCVA